MTALSCTIAVVEDRKLITGSVWGLFLYEVAEEIDLGAIRRILGATPAGREPAFRHPAPEYVRYEQPPAVEHAGSQTIASGIWLRHGSVISSMGSRA
ncbi:MAG: hypothetical protein JO061_00555 [Acidobacteriaceae bacterium]|nr:hypothetical protein [Acidobacteriaceae bacterium]